ncbi:MAG: hypothetical protein IKQ46_10600 [Bacteroidales bacterium]|nr:hypothetical protein [Bacteroidales bacterium]
MRNIIISDGVDTITLLNDLVFDIEPQEVSTSATMASGRLVKDIIGYKNKLVIPCGYLSLENISKLKSMIKSNNGVLQVAYPGPDGDRVEWFILEQPTYTTFSYDDEGVAVWKGVTITATAVEVEQW